MTSLLSTGLYSDLTLMFHDEMTGTYLFSIHAHYTILYTSGISYFRNLIDSKFGGQREKLDGKDIVKIYLNFEFYTISMIQYFIELVYIGKITKELLNQTMIDYINNNLLYFHQLSLYFTFVSLEKYCLEIIYSEMNTEIFEKLSFYCLSPSPSSCSNLIKYSINGDKLDLYNRMVQWYQYCVEKPILNDVMNNHGFLIHHQKEIDNFHLVNLPKKSISSHSSIIHYYHYSCRACLHSKKNTFFNEYNVYLGGIISSDKKKSCHFSLMRQQDRRNQFDLFVLYKSLTIQTDDSSSSSSSDNMSIEGSHSHEESINTIPSFIKMSLFSKKLQLDTIESNKSLNDLTRVLSFDLHDKKYCYEARCTQCQVYKPVYIIHITVDSVK